jgi:hypothetical protein
LDELFCSSGAAGDAVAIVREAVSRTKGINRSKLKFTLLDCSKNLECTLKGDMNSERLVGGTVVVLFAAICWISPPLDAQLGQALDDKHKLRMRQLHWLISRAQKLHLIPGNSNCYESRHMTEVANETLSSRNSMSL